MNNNQVSVERGLVTEAIVFSSLIMQNENIVSMETMEDVAFPFIIERKCAICGKGNGFNLRFDLITATTICFENECFIKTVNK